MKIVRAKAKNFQSYKDISFDYSDLGLALVSGANGSGKSTLLDLCAWVLFGVTSKDGAADDVCSWDAGGATVGEVTVGTPNGDILVRRTRKPNDLYWVELNLYTDGTSTERGKDLGDTQKLLESRLGVTSDLFFTGSYMHQFSKADAFFIAKAKDRRDVLEKIADQEFAIDLGNKASEARKVAKIEVTKLGMDLSHANGKEDALANSLKDLSESSKHWEINQSVKIDQARLMSAAFDAKKAEAIKGMKSSLILFAPIPRDYDTQITVLRTRIQALKPAKEMLTQVSGKVIALKTELQVLKKDKAKLETVTHACPTCKRDYDDVPDYSKEIAELEARQAEAQDKLNKKLEIVADLNSHLSEEDSVRKLLEETLDGKAKSLRALEVQETTKKQIALEEARTNPYIAQVVQLEAETDPFSPRLDGTAAALEDAMDAATKLNSQYNAAAHRVTSLTQIYDASFKLRGLLMEKAVKSIEESTNGYLERYFDAALRISLVITGSDKIEVEIFNEGNLAPFTALSGGERCMLKLCFSLSLMKAAQNKAGISFDLLMLDEPFNGLNSERKVQAFGLLQELEQQYGSVLVIDHDPELKTQFHKVFTVEKNGDTSKVYES